MKTLRDTFTVQCLASNFELGGMGEILGVSKVSEVVEHYASVADEREG